jgi:hypothetical protein
MFDSRWTFNGNLEAPTFTPSLMTNRGAPDQCHLVLTDGIISFCDDCWHELKNTNIPIEDYLKS